MIWNRHRRERFTAAGIACVEVWVSGAVMAFLVYFFVLLVAAASVVFGLDWTQAPLNPPPYAAQTASVAPNASPKIAPSPKIAANPPAMKPATSSVAVARTTDQTTATPQAPVPAPTAALPDQATQAQASATPADTTASTPAASCNVSACSAAYRSFRASDCTYQPTSGERRMCTKIGSTGKVAAAAHSRSARRDDYRVGERRLSDRRDYYDRRDAYDDRRGGWGFGGLFGGGGNDY